MPGPGLCAVRLPDGQITLRPVKPGCPACSRKIFRLTRRANQRYQLARLTRQEGRAHVTNARWDAVDADSCDGRAQFDADGEVVWSWRPGAGAKFAEAKLLQMTVARKPVTGESAK